MADSARQTAARWVGSVLPGGTAIRTRLSVMMFIQYFIWGADEFTEELKDILCAKAKAGVEVIEARISHLAYAPEIAAAMLQRQQAGAIIAARQRIVEGAVGMVEMALQMLSHKGIVTLDEERKAAMVSNLLVVLCSEQNTQPVVNTGSLYT